jgi:hypothetical protein
MLKHDGDYRASITIALPDSLFVCPPNAGGAASSVVPVAKSIAVAARIAIERIFIWITERYYRVKVTFSPPDGLRRDGSCLEPFERTRAEIEFVSGLLVGGAAQARRVIDAVGAKSRQSFLLDDLKRFWRPASACERRQPDALLAWMVVNDVVGARSTFERRDCSGCGVLDMDDTRHALARRR